MIRVFLLSGSAAVLLSGCAIYDSSLTTHGQKGNGGTSGNAGDDQGGGAGQESGGASQAGGMGNGGGSAGAGVCVSKTYPAQPMGSDLGGDIEIVVVQADIDLGDSEPSTANAPTRFRDIGFDLDGVCTTTQAPKLGKCALPAASDGVPDGPNGQDNAMGQVIQITRNLLGSER